MRFGSIALIASATLAALAAGKAIILNDQNFVHDTQIGTGMTTGDWFVKFYAPWCGHCKRLEPTWDELAEDLKGEVNIAKLDATVNRNSIGQFDIRGYPTLIFFKDNKYYRYSGPRTKEALTQFVRGGYQDAKVVSGPVPPPLTTVTRVLQHLKRAYMDCQTMFRHNPLAAVCLIAFGSIVGTLIGGGVAIYTARSSFPCGTRGSSAPAPKTGAKGKKSD